MSVSEPLVESAVRDGLFVDESDEVHLLASECTRCSALAFPSAPVCPECQALSPRPRHLSSRGTVYSFTVVRSRPPGYAGPVPYGLGLVELPEGLRVFTMLMVDDGPPLAVGSEVEAVLVDVGGDDQRFSYAFRTRRGVA